MAGKYQRYPEYKDSGVEWIGDIPSNWSVKRLKNLVSLQTQKASDESRRVGLENIESWSGKLIETETDFEGSGTSFQMGDILFGKLRPYLAKVYSATFDGSAVGDFHVMRPLDKSSSKYLRYMMTTREYINEVNSSTYGAKMPRASWEFTSSIRLPIGTKQEVKSIANFLDHETAKIDALIAKQEKLIELLKEKRQAVISHAVTKGLNPDVPMKDSGIEWLGEVPEHWKVCQLKHATLLMQTGPFGSQIHAEDYVNGGIPLINPSHLVDGNIVPDYQVSVSESTKLRLKRHMLDSGDIVFARRGELGRCAIVDQDSEGWLCGTGSLKVKLSNRLIDEFGYLQFSSLGFRQELSLSSKGSTMENLNTDTLGQVKILLPGIEEQKEIVKYVKQQEKRFALLTELAKQKIQLLVERKSSLISAAVTGKIDVRHHASHPAGNAEISAEVQG